MADNIQILIDAILSLRDTAKNLSQIKADLPKLQQALDSDKNAQLQITAKLNENSKNIIQNQLKEILAKANTNNIKIGVELANQVQTQNITQNLNEGLKVTQEQAKETAKVVEQTVKTINASDISGNMLKQFAKEFNITQKDISSNNFKELFVQLANAWNNKDAQQYSDILEKIIKQTKELSQASRVYQDVKSAIAEVKEMAGLGGGKVTLPTGMKAELKSMYGDAKEVAKVLNTIFGAGNWNYAENIKSAYQKGTSLDTLLSTGKMADRYNDMVGCLDTVYQKIQQIKTSYSSVFDYMSPAAGNEAIESYLRGLLQLDEQTKVTTSDTNNLVQAEQNLNTQSSATDKLASNLKETEKQAEKTGEALNQVNKVAQNSAKVNSASENYLSNNRQLLDSIGTFNAEDQAIQKLYETFKKLNVEVSSTEQKTAKGFLEGFTINVKSATGEVEKFKYQWKDINRGLKDSSGNALPEEWKYALTNINASDTAVKRLIESQQKYQDKVKATITDLQSEADKIKTAYTDTNGNKAIRNTEHLTSLDTQYQKIVESIKTLESADKTTMDSMKANVEAEIEKLKTLIAQYKNAEYAATSLRTKDVGTIKNIQSNEIDIFTNKVASSEPILKAMTTDIANLRTTLSSVTDSNGLVNFLNQFDIAKSKFDLLNSMYVGIDSYGKQLDQLTARWQKQGVYIGDVQKTVENLKASLANVTTTEGFTNWVNDFSTQIGKISDVSVRVAAYKNELAQAKEEWKSQGLLIGNIKNEVTALSRSSSNIRKADALETKIQEFDALKTKVASVGTNLQNQVAATKEILKTEIEITKLNPNDDINRKNLEQKLSNQKAILEGYKTQSATLQNIISFEEMEEFVTRATREEREKLVKLQNTQASNQIAKQQKDLESYNSEIDKTIKKLNTLKNDTQFKNNASNASVNQITTEINNLISSYQALKGQISGVTPETLSTQFPTLTSQLENLRKSFATTTASAETLKKSFREDTAIDNLKTKIEVLKNQIIAFKNANGKAMASSKLSSNGMTYAAEIDNLLTKLSTCANSSDFGKLKNQFRSLQSEIKAVGLTGGTLFSNLWKKMKKFASWMGMTSLMTRSSMYVRNLFKEVYTLDTALVDLKKAFKGTEQDLESFYYSANDTAKTIGTTTQEIIEQASAWSRLGYSSAEAAETMAKNSAIFKNISPGMDIDTATDGLVSMMKAFDIEANDVLDGIMSKVNVVGNEFATDNQSIVEAMTRSSSAMAAANNTLEETIALNTASI